MDKHTREYFNNLLEDLEKRFMKSQITLEEKEKDEKFIKKLILDN